MSHVMFKRPTGPLRRTSKRFDFGIVLRDIFPRNDIHPKLKQLFKQSYRVSMTSGLTVEEILRDHLGSLDTRLKLKQIIINDPHYQVRREIDASPGAYFWAIQHFLGLMPTPLLPERVGETRFDWNELSERCHKGMRHYYETAQRVVTRLDYEIATALNGLPNEHFLLVLVLVTFIRKTAMKPICQHQISRRTLVILGKYFAPAVGNRPFRPDEPNQGRSTLFPLFFYMLSRWNYIEKNNRKIGYLTTFLDIDRPNMVPCPKPPSKDFCNQVQFQEKSLPNITVYFPKPGETEYQQMDAGSQTDMEKSIRTTMQNNMNRVRERELYDSNTASSFMYNIPVPVEDNVKYNSLADVKPMLDKLALTARPDLNGCQAEEDIQGQIENVYEESDDLPPPPPPLLPKPEEKFKPRVVGYVLKQGTGAIPKQRKQICEAEVLNEADDLPPPPPAEADDLPPPPPPEVVDRPPRPMVVRGPPKNKRASYADFRGCGSHEEWKDIVQGTKDTWQKVKRYSYDEPTTERDRSLVLNANKARRTKSLMNRECKRKLDESEIYFRHSYFRFKDVIDSCSDISEEYGFSNPSSKVAEQDVIEVVDEGACGGPDEGNKKKKQPKKKWYRLKKMPAINLDFLGWLIPKCFARPKSGTDEVAN